MGERREENILAPVGFARCGLARDERPLRRPLHCRVAKYEHHADQRAIGIIDGRGRILDGALLRVAADEQRVIGQTDRLALLGTRAAGLGNGVRVCSSRI